MQIKTLILLCDQDDCKWNKPIILNSVMHRYCIHSCPSITKQRIDCLSYDKELPKPKALVG